MLNVEGRYPESAKIFQYRGMYFDGFRVVRVKFVHETTAAGGYWGQCNIETSNPHVLMLLQIIFHRTLHGFLSQKIVIFPENCYFPRKLLFSQKIVIFPECLYFSGNCGHSVMVDIFWENKNSFNVL